ncbi:hypothetical protein EOL10_21875 [Citrobacter freundii]|nr:hypothetical protein EOL10_21875 [Citrobacter freundii]
MAPSYSGCKKYTIHVIHIIHTIQLMHTVHTVHTVQNLHTLFPFSRSDPKKASPGSSFLSTPP